MREQSCTDVSSIVTSDPLSLTAPLSLQWSIGHAHRLSDLLTGERSMTLDL